jgi:aspartate-semialdehyde dehydrogenase
MGYKVAVVGATGNVGREMLNILDERKFPADEVVVLASRRSVGVEVSYGDRTLKVKALEHYDFSDVDICLMSAGGSVSKEWSPKIGATGAVVIDNSSAWRMDPDCPLVVPEVNAHDIPLHTKKRIIANPNCSTIQMVVALKPIHDAARVKRVVVSTYQAVSGAGGRALAEFDEEVRSGLFGDKLAKRSIFPRPMAFNAIPQVPQKDAYLLDGYTVEERKMIDETRKIMGDASIRVSPTCVRVPVRNSHSESVNVETARKVTAREAMDLWRKAPGVVLSERPEDFPTPAEVSGKGETFVGRVREDPSIENGLNFWVVADNILKGAALNAVQIAEVMIR